MDKQETEQTIDESTSKETESMEEKKSIEKEIKFETIAQNTNELNCKEFCELNDDELLISSYNLIDKASDDSLQNCFENIFKNDIQKYLLKLVIKEQIQHLPQHKTNNWKRLCLLQKISHLKSKMSHLKSKKIKPAILSCEEITDSKTDRLVIAGYIRNDTTINNIPTDVISIISSYSHNLIANPLNLPLIVYDSVNHHNISEKQQIKETQLTKQELMSVNISENTQQPKLITPNKLHLYQKNNVMCHQYNKISRFKEIKTCCNTTCCSNPDRRRPSDYVENDICASVQCLDVANQRLLNFGGFNISYKNTKYRDQYKHYVTRKIYGQNILKENEYVEQIGQLNYSRGYMSLCKLNNDKIVAIGGQTNYVDYYFNYHEETEDAVIINVVELFDLKTNEAIVMQSMNISRAQCGSFYNKYSNDIVVFGGNKNAQRTDMWQYGISNTMEIYDFHKNVWFNYPYKSNKYYAKYPCIWNVGSKCIFVAQFGMNKKVHTRHNNYYGARTTYIPSYIECEFVDLRENKMTFTGWEIDLTAFYPEENISKYDTYYMFDGE
eukprot:138850_1